MVDSANGDNPYALLDGIELPDDLRDLKLAQLPRLAEEVRRFLIDSVSETGGHLAAGLGTVELTIALHYVFETPFDRLVWDTGHQSYPHKILTGRRRSMATLRQKDGLAGFPRRLESEYDTFGTGHAGTSIGAAMGMATALASRKDKPHVVAVIGDGAMTAGMAFEALNHAGAEGTDMLVVLNDNEMSISPNVGGLSKYLTRILSGKTYEAMRESGKKVLSVVPPMRELAKRAEEHVKGMVIPGTLFEELGFNYFGPIDGHDIETMVKTMRNLRALRGPRLLHVITRKGKGYEPAEENPCTYHGVSAFEPGSGRMKKGKAAGPTYTQVFGQWLCDMAQQDERLVAITPAMCEGSGLTEFARRFPKRYHDVGIAEQHSVTFAAGLACEDKKPVVAIYSSFLQRAYDQLIHDVALQNLPVLFAVDRAGLVGPDGPTHAGFFDLSFMQCIPNMTIMAPADENECRQMLYTGFLHDGPAAVRYPRGTGPGIAVEDGMKALPIGTAELRRQGRKIALLSFGALLPAALEAAEELDATVANMRFVKPLDEELIVKLAADHQLLVTLEDNAVLGGAGSAVQQCLSRHGLENSVLVLGLPDLFVEHGGREELLAQCGLDGSGIINSVRSYLAHETCQVTPLQVKSY